MPKIASITAALLSFTAAAALAPSAAAAAELYLKDMKAEVRIVPEARGDIAVRILSADPRLPTLRISRAGQNVVVDGGLRNRRNSCGNGFARMGTGPGRTRLEVRVPIDIAVRASGAVHGSIGSARVLSLNTDGCGDWRLSDARRLTLNMDGLGDVSAGRLGPTSVDIDGLGHARFDSVSGPLNVNVNGLGGVNVKHGRVGHLRASLDGLGSIRFGGTADSLDARASGLGHIRVARVIGEVRKNRDGVARIKVDRVG